MFFSMPKPMTAKNFASTAKQLRDASKLSAERSMSASVKGNYEICIMSMYNLSQAVSADGYMAT